MEKWKSADALGIPVGPRFLPHFVAALHLNEMGLESDARAASHKMCRSLEGGKGKGGGHHAASEERESGLS